MPIFEFTCNDCRTGRRFSTLVGVVADAAPPTCPACGGVNLTKAVSRFARLRSEDDAIDSLAERADNLDESDPRAMRALMREMAGELGEDADDDVDAAMEEAFDGGSMAGDADGAGFDE
jgi:putative FmdB family regulatory protein